MTKKTQTSETAVAVASDNIQVTSVDTGVFTNKDTFEHSQRVAMMLTKSELVPDTFRDKPANVMIALEIATRIGASPLMVMQNLYIVHGRPAWSSQFLIATLNACGRFSALRYEEDDKDGGRTRAVATDKRTGELCLGAWVSIDMAKREGWYEKKGSKWQTMPELMRRYRAAAFFTRQFAPEVSMGFHTAEEVQEVTVVDVQKQKNNQEVERLRQLILKADSAEKLNKLRPHVEKYPELEEDFTEALMWMAEQELMAKEEEARS